MGPRHLQRAESLWSATPRYHRFSQLERDAHFDVVVIGAGITGLTTATLLKRSGKKVAVLEQHDVGGGETGHTTAHTTELVDARYTHLISAFGLEAARLVASSSRAAIEQIAWLDTELGAGADFRRVPAYLYTEKKSQRGTLKDEVEAAQKVGLPAEFVNEAPLPFSNRGALFLGNQAQFHPVKYLLALADAVDGNGSEVFEHSRAIAVDEGTLCRVQTEAGPALTASRVVVATNTPITSPYLIHTRVALYRTYAIAGELGKPPGAPGLFWDLEDPYHYTRSHEGLWIIGGEDHKTGHSDRTEEHFSRLEEYAVTHFGLRDLQYQWSGQIAEPDDGLPFIGRSPGTEKVFIATGYSGNGMTFGTIAGMLLHDLIIGRVNPWAEVYRVNRLKFTTSATTFIAENKDYPLCLLADRLRLRKLIPAEIEPGEARVGKFNGKAVAMHRDEAGHLHCVQAECTHMGCLVRWNSAEGSWDCPCHGSRFGMDGEVLNAPATRALSRVPVPEEEVSIPEPKPRKPQAA